MQIALDDLIETQIEQAGDKLYQSNALAIPLAPEIGTGGFSLPPIAHRFEDRCRVAFARRRKTIALGLRLTIKDRGQNFAIGVELAKHFNLLIDPLRRGGSRRAQHDQGLARRKGLAHGGGEITAR